MIYDIKERERQTIVYVNDKKTESLSPKLVSKTIHKVSSNDNFLKYQWSWVL
jgi:hypothetical protein